MNGLRDYGTGSWEGGDADCDHLRPGTDGPKDSSSTLESRASNQNHEREPWPSGVCGKCGARRVDGQIGLEETPDQWVENLVAVFREVRRVLTSHGTCWVEVGDSYNAHPGQRKTTDAAGAKQTTKDGSLGAPSRFVDSCKPKDLIGAPWLLAFALRADGWWLRSEIIWSRPNPMPESVRDRPTKAHSTIFLLSKRPRYFFDPEAVREPWTGRMPTEFRGGNVYDAFDNTNGGKRTASHRELAAPPQAETLDGSDGEAPRGPDGRRATHVQGQDGSLQHRDGERWPNSGRNVRSVWTIPTQPFPEAHFATFPEELVRRCLLAGCPEWVCRECGKARERIVERGELQATEAARIKEWDRGKTDGDVGGSMAAHLQRDGFKPNHVRPIETLGFSDCGHNNYRPGIILDPFAGSGTTCYVARKHNRHAIGIDLNPDYLEMAARRLAQQSLFAEITT